MTKHKDEVVVKLGERRVLTEEQVTKLLGWHPVSVRRLVSTKRLKVAGRLGRLPLIDYGAVEEYALASPWWSKLFPGKPRSPGSR